MLTYADVCVLTYAGVCRCSEHAGGIAASQARGGAQVADLRALLATCEQEAAAARRLLDSSVEEAVQRLAPRCSIYYLLY